VPIFRSLQPPEPATERATRPKLRAHSDPRWPERRVRLPSRSSNRLSRNVHFISGLMAHKTPFLVANLGPGVEPFLLHLYSALAEKERGRSLSERRRPSPRPKRVGRFSATLVWLTPTPRQGGRHGRLERASGNGGRVHAGRARGRRERRRQRNPLALLIGLLQRPPLWCSYPAGRLKGSRGSPRGRPPILSKAVLGELVLNGGGAQADLRAEAPRIATSIGRGS
jgi:hypothetical protein